MDTSAFEKKNGKYYLKYTGAESYYKNGLLLECIQHFKSFMKGKLLDLGCGNKPYSIIYSEVCDLSIGCDLPFSLHQDANVEFKCYAEDIDKYFEPGYFDCVLCTEVLEHTVNDQKVVANINKVLKIDGNLIISAPFTYVLHEAPHDYRRYTLYGLKNILESNGFEVLSILSIGGTISSGFYIFYYSITKIFFYSLKKIGLNQIHENNFVKLVTSIPEFIFYKLNISSFKKKLIKNKYPSKNEMFSSLGYFIVAKKMKDL